MSEALLSVAGLLALVYCPRLFYLEEVERLRVADERVFAGRRAHVEQLPSEEGRVERLTFESETLGIQGTLDLLRYRDGGLVVYERKVGRAGLPTTVLGALFHGAEHSTRHAGQFISTARLVAASD